MSIVLSRGIFLNNESTYKLPITRELSCSNISFAKQKVYLTMNSLHIIEFILGTKYFAVFYNSVPIVEKMSLKGGRRSTMFLSTLQRPYKIPGVEPTALISLCSLILKGADVFKDFKYSLIRFS